MGASTLYCTHVPWARLRYSHSTAWSPIDAHATRRIVKRHGILVWRIFQFFAKFVRLKKIRNFNIPHSVQWGPSEQTCFSELPDFVTEQFFNWNRLQEELEVVVTYSLYS